MASTNVARFSPILALLIVPLAPFGARADEAFLCGPNTVVYVKAEDLELKKKTDPCIAAFFGLTVAPAGKADHGPVRTIATPKAGGSPPPAAQSTAPEFKTLAAPETAEPVAPLREQSAALQAPRASPGTDFRNVRIINAEPGGEQWFKHEK